ncbi:MAG: hypothetical protein AAF449_14865, partial [Myxococcota bacterium]
MRAHCSYALIALAAGTTACRSSASAPAASQPTGAADATASADQATQALAAKVAQFAPARLTTNIESLPPSEKAALDLIIEASKLLDPIFDRQAWQNNPTHRHQLAQDNSPLGQLKLAYFDIMRGPWDRQDHFAPFAVEQNHPPGAGFYPEDLTAKEFDAYVAANPEQKEALESLFTVVRRDDDRLVAVPYSEAYKQWLVPAAQKLKEAAARTQNQSLKRFLTLRAEAFLTDDYYESDKAWMDLESQVEVTIGPYEVYEDQLKANKAAFEAFVTVSDPKASAK